jgi:hypothetical protein
MGYMAPEETKKALAGRGLGVVFRQNYRDDREYETVKLFVLNNPDLMEDHIDWVDTPEHLNKIFLTANRLDINLYSFQFWKRKIDKMLKNATAHSSRSIFNGDADYLISAACMAESFDWTSLFESMYAHQASHNWVRNSFSRVLREFAKREPSKLKKHVDEHVFFAKEKKPPFCVRGFLYQEYIVAGLLSKKTARKIRSDGSEDASLQGLRALTDNLDSYSNSDELLLQFTDSRYEQVICHLAENLPEYLIASIMGTEFYYAKRRIEARLERIERDKAKVVNIDVSAEL